MISFSLAQAMVYGSQKNTASERKRFHYCLVPLIQMQGSFLCLKSPSSALPGTDQPGDTSDSDQTEKNVFSQSYMYEQVNQDPAHDNATNIYTENVTQHQIGVYCEKG